MIKPDARRGAALAGVVLLAVAGFARAQGADLPLFNSAPAPGGGQSYSLPIQTLLVLTALTFLPAVLLMMTSFTRIIIVLSLLRQALGTQGAPPNPVLIGLALFLTLFVMGPVADRIYADAYVPYVEKKVSGGEAIERAQVPLRTFMLKQTREADIALFVKLARAKPPATRDDIPFLIIDLVVASALMSMGMMMLSPVLISLPFKLMLFVLVDGWTLLLGSLVASF